MEAGGRSCHCYSADLVGSVAHLSVLRYITCAKNSIGESLNAS